MKFNKWILGLTAVGAMMLTSPAHADIYSSKAVAFTNSAASSTNGPFYNNTSTNLTTLSAASASLIINSDPIPVGQNRGFVLLDQFVGTNVLGTANVTNRFDLGVLLGTNIVKTTTHPLKMVSSLNATTNVVDALVVDKSTINNVAYVYWYDVWVAAQSGQTNVITISPCLESYSLYAP